MSDFQTYKIGGNIGGRVTITNLIVEPEGRHPVYLVWDHQNWCPAVCKIFRSSRRAQQEHDILTRVAHPNIVKSMGTLEPAIMLLEYLSGDNLGDYAARQPRGWMPLSDALRTIIHLGCALEHVHRQGYVHMDIKPGNIIVSNGRPVLFDFGTARRIGDTRPSVVQGTDPYMAPEECALGDVSPAADVFSMGVTLYEMMTREIPYPEPTEGEPYPQMHQAALPLRELRPDLPRSLEQLLARCLDRDPSKRPELKQLLPELNNLIRKGPKMWPDMLDLAAA